MKFHVKGYCTSFEIHLGPIFYVTGKYAPFRSVIVFSRINVNDGIECK